MGADEPLIPIRLPLPLSGRHCRRMSAASSAFSRSTAPVGLAVAGADMVRSRLLMNVPIDTAAQREHAKEKFYVICQSFGWTLFVGVQLAFLPLFGSGESTRNATLTSATLIMVGLLGLLLTHYARPFIGRWSWKDLGWRALIPRVLGMSAVLSFLWSLIGYGYIYVVCGLPWPSKYPPALIFTFSWFNGVTLFVGWFCLYFFYHLSDRFKRLEIERLQLIASVKEAELRALKSQINPHFLFNSLNSLRALIDEDAPRARESVTRLANMLRYSLQSGQQETVVFEEELRIVEDYLALEQIRHENRLRLRWDISAEARAQALPPMLLQTLVENAVKYGIGSRREGGELFISAHCDAAAAGQPAMLHIRVTNPGNLAVPINGATATAEKSTGLGLRNASDRLRLLFGDKAALCLHGETAGLVTADVRIPINSVD